MKYTVLLIVCFFFSISDSYAQSFWFGPKGGGTLGIQQWQSSQRPPLFAGHVGFFIETYSEEDEELPGSLYASLGLHQRGSSERSFLTAQNLFVPRTSFVFNNLSLQVGAKKFFTDKFYYVVGIRGEYTLFTNLDEINNNIISYYFPQNEFVIPLVGGITGGAGVQYELGELYGLSIEFTINPDFFRQYYSPQLEGIVSPITGNPVTVRENEIRNTSIELTVAMRFLRKVVYY